MVEDRCCRNFGGRITCHHLHLLRPVFDLVHSSHRMLGTTGFDTLTCTVGTANLAAGTYNLVLILVQWSVGPAQPAGTLSASTTNNNVLVDAASTTTGAVPHIGS